MDSFAGFPSGSIKLFSLPGLFFSELLPEINHMGELKVTLYSFWFIQEQGGKNPFISIEDFLNDNIFMKGLVSNTETAEEYLKESLERAVQRGSLLQLEAYEGSEPKLLYFINSARGRATLKAFQLGNWRPEDEPHLSVTLGSERPNIYRLYEQNIGPLTPLIAETLQDAEEEYPGQWIEEAFRLAVENNARSWRYIEAILKSWNERGRDGAHRKHTEEDYRRYIKGEYGEFGEY